MQENILEVMVLGWHINVERPFAIRSCYNPCHREQNWPDGKVKVYRKDETNRKCRPCSDNKDEDKDE